MAIEQSSVSGRPRNQYLDFCKGIAIFLVVLGHAVQYGSGTEFLASSAFFDDFLFRLIYCFHMPLFMLISGYVCYAMFSRRTVLSALKRQARALLLPAACWTVLYRVYLQLVGGGFASMQAFLDWLARLPGEILKSHWFLWAVFWCSVIVLAVRKLAKDCVWLYPLIVALLLLLPNLLIENCYLYVFVFPYFVIGYLSARFGLAIRKRKHIWIAAALSLVAFAALFPWFSYDAYIYTTRISLTDTPTLQQLCINGYRWVLGLAGSAAALILAYGLWRLCQGGLCFVRHIFLFLGKRTLGIYIISSYLNYELLIPVTENYSAHYAINFLESAVILFVATGITFLLERFRYSRLALLGGR